MSGRDDMLLRFGLRCNVRLGIFRAIAGFSCAALFCLHQNRVQAQEPVKSVEDSVFLGLVKPNEPGFAALVRYGGRNGYQRTEGVTDLGSKTRITPRTNFRLASFTKQFTAMAIMLLVHDGKIGYEDKLTKFFPDFPAYGKDITIRNLLNQTSGLPDYEDLMDAAEKSNGPTWSAEKQIQDAEVLELLKKADQGKFGPGTNWSYSNSGYVVLGLIVAKVSGKPYREFLHDRIFAPLKMSHTVVYQKGQNQVANRAYGHSKEKESGRLIETDQSATSATLGDGGIYSNLEDLAKWDDALRKHTLLSEKEFQPALVAVKLNDGSQPNWPKEPNDDNLHPGKPVSYGFGWFLDPFPDPYFSHTDHQPLLHARMWHTGSTMGFRTVIERFTQGKGQTVIILCNRADVDPEKLALKLAFPPLMLKK
jgi:CubicO group peptidase (beta-lactamase class C family)